MSALVRLFAIIPLLIYSTSASAIYKCEEQGKVVYTDAKCENGKVTTVDTTNSHISKTALNEAAERGKHEKATLKQLESARRKDEAAEEKARQKQLRASEALRKKCQAMALKVKWSEEDAASATGKSAEKARRVALRQNEKYRTECGSH